MHIFHQCTTHKLLHLLGANIMYSLEEDFFGDGTNWWSWNGTLTSEIDDIIGSFIATIANRESIPNHTLIIAQIGKGVGGLGFLYPSHIAAPNFVITMNSSMNYTTQGIRPNPDIALFKFCPTVAALYSWSHNPDSTYFH